MGIASNYVKADLCLNDSQANIFPSLVFFWFLIFSVPMGMLMNRIGRKKTVLLSLLVTFVSQLLPIFGDSYPPLAMGLAGDAVEQSGAVAVMTVGVLYLLLYTFKIKTDNHE